MGYIKLLVAPVKVGYNSIIRPGGGTITTSDLLKEVYFVRLCLRNLGRLTSYKQNEIHTPLFNMGF